MRARADAPARLLTDHMLYIRRYHSYPEGRSLSDRALLDISFVCSIINQFTLSYGLILLILLQQKGPGFLVLSFKLLSMMIL
jgi:hypothetical protein